MDIYTIMPTISTALIVTSAVLVAFGWRLAIKRRLEEHQRMMFWAAITAILFFIIYSSRTVISGNTEWGGPDSLKPFYVAFLLFHITLATIGAVFGITTLTLGYKKKFVKHRKWGRVTSIVWFITAITGTMVYILLYLMYPGGHTKPMIDAIFGW
ncbi:DUF420 domain-containing protein [Paenibacillus alkaliterrae]|uniref:DUF420 domain-containing protein n=1 Tax=Paenibacillus alkaliterrae TaxID=320909 RepID=UPI001F2E5965|nr:DUF420 domain-containing protein [Paenibacillus alkaliterrae]MCF2939103.1 DUF420 domain-containing protein [Paenibacillus alkaliterrae]